MDDERTLSSDGALKPRFSRRERIAAAKVRVTIDKRRGVETPHWVIDLAEEEFPGLPDKDPYAPRAS